MPLRVDGPDRGTSSKKKRVRVKKKRDLRSPDARNPVRPPLPVPTAIYQAPVPRTGGRPQRTIDVGPRPREGKKPPVQQYKPVAEWMLNLDLMPGQKRAYRKFSEDKAKERRRPDHGWGDLLGKVLPDVGHPGDLLGKLPDVGRYAGAVSRAYTQGVDIEGPLRSVDKALGRAVKYLSNPDVYEIDKKDLEDFWAVWEGSNKFLSPTIYQIVEDSTKPEEERRPIDRRQLALELAVLPVPGLKGIPAVGTVALRKLLGRGAEEPLLLGGRKVTRTLSKGGLEVTVPAAKGFIPRQIGNAFESYIREPLSKTRLVKTRRQKIVREIEKNQRALRKALEEPGSYLKALGSHRSWVTLRKKVTPSQQYAFRLVGEGVDPEDAIGWEIHAAEMTTDVSQKIFHLTHADLIRSASQYVMRDPEGLGLVFRADAPPVLHDIWDLANETSKSREEIYAKLGLLEEEQMEGRVQAVGKLMDAPSWTQSTAGMLDKMKALPERQKLEEVVLASTDDEQVARDLMRMADSRALGRESSRRAVLHEELEELLQRGSLDEEGWQRMESVKAQLEAPPDTGLYYGRLHDIVLGIPDDAVERLAKSKAHGRLVQNLTGLPTKVNVPGKGEIEVGHSVEAREIAERYMARAGLPYTAPSTYVKVDPERAARIAKAYDEMLDVSDPAATPDYVREVQLAYRAMADETVQQYKEILRSGYEFEFMPMGQNPYEASPRLAMLDLKDNKHLYVFPTDEGFGAGGTVALANNQTMRGGYIHKPAVYLRFGDLPTGPSANHLEGGFEQGVSVYAAWLDSKTGKYVLPSGSEQYLSTLDEFAANRGVSRVSGNVSPHSGSDGEPLLEAGSISRESDVSLDDIVTEGNPYLTLSGRELDEGQTPNWHVEVNPLLADTGIKWLQEDVSKPVTVNDLFRAVHDFFGHYKEGVGFRADGEENAWRSHSAMYSPEARRAMTSETRGQNSWVNFGPHGKANRTARTEDTVFADQKTGLLPDWVVAEGSGDEASDVARGAEGTPGLGAEEGVVAPGGLGNLGVQGLYETVRGSPGKRRGGKISIREDLENPTTVLEHELTHFHEDIHLTPEQRRIFQQTTGHLLSTYKGAEAFAEMSEEWLMAIAEGRVPNVPEKLIPALERLGNQVLRERRNVVRGRHEAPDEIHELFDSFVQYSEIRGGGKLRIPYRRGMPANMRHPLRQMNALARYASGGRFGGGRKSAIGRGSTDPTVTKIFRGWLRRMGNWRGTNATDLLTDDLFKAVRVDDAYRMRKELLKGSTDMPESIDDVPVKVDPSIDAPKTLRQLLDMFDDFEMGEKRSLRELEKVEMKSTEDLINHLFPNMVNGEDPRAVAMQLLEKKITEPIENIRWIPREAFDASDILNTPAAIAATQQGWKKLEVAGKVVDAFNDLMKATILTLNLPPYITMNLAGNTVMNLFQQGPFAFYNIPRSAFLSQQLGHRNANWVDHVMGSGFAHQADLRTPAKMALNPVNNLISKLVDLVPRRAAFLHEAQKLGYTSEESMTALREGVKRGDEEAVSDYLYIWRRANNAIIDYEDLGPVERRVVTRVLFIYPWIKGATKYSARYPADHPVQAMAMGLAYMRQQSLADEELGDRPWYSDLEIPIGNVTRFGEEYPLTFNPKQLLPQTTPYEYGKTALGFLEGDTRSQPLVETLNPFLSNLVTALSGKRAFDQQEVGQGALSFLEESDPRNAPLIARIEDLLKSDAELEDSAGNKLYPRNKNDLIWKAILGSMAPKPFNPEKGQWLARGRTGPTPQQDWGEKLKAYEDAGNQVTPQMRQAVQAKSMYEEAKDKAHERKSDLSDAEIVMLKFEVALKLHPELRSYRSYIKNGLRDPRAVGRLESAVEKMLGWDILSNVSSYNNDREKVAS